MEWLEMPSLILIRFVESNLLGFMKIFINKEENEQQLPSLSEWIS